MSFKIIQEINNKRKAVLTIVPERFESNGVFWFPPSNWSTRKLNNILRNPFAVPDLTSWEARPCAVKKKNKIFALAEEQEEELLQKNATELEEDADAESEASETFVGGRCDKKTDAARSPQPDFNYVLEEYQAEHPQQTNEGQIEIFRIENKAPSIEFSLEDINLADDNVNKYFVNNKNESNVLLYSGTTAQSEPPDSEAKLILENQEKIFKILNSLTETMTTGFAKLLAQGDCLAECQSFKLNNENKEHRFGPATEAFAKIETGEQALRFENQLMSDEFRCGMIQQMAFIIGKNGKRSSEGWTCCYELIDLIFHRSFLTKCSWTGASTSQQEEGKIPFFKYKNVLKLFAQVVADADPEFSMEKTKEFFKKLLRNSTRFQNQELSQTRKSTKRERGPRKDTIKKLLVANENCETTQNQDIEQNQL